MSTKSQVLAFLMNKSPNFISGEEMAKNLSLSRTAIWKAINELKKEGHLISSGKHKGYCYEKSDILSKEGIQQALLSSTPDLSIKIMEDSDSTMKDAKLAAINNQPANTLIVANTQAEAKGRFGRSFFSKANQGIYMSMLLKPEKTFADIAQYTVIMAVAVAKAMDELANVNTQIKWVNDIYLNNKKVCGILSEAMSDVNTGQISHIIIGLGINFSIQPSEFPVELQEIAVSLFSELSPTSTRNELIASIWNQFYQLLQMPTLDYLTVYRNKSLILGKHVYFNQGNRSYQGQALSITDKGELVVQLVDRSTKVVSSGEVSLKKLI